jgi:hypothetical protein
MVQDQQRTIAQYREKLMRSINRRRPKEGHRGEAFLDDKAYGSGAHENFGGPSFKGNARELQGFRAWMSIQGHGDVRWEIFCCW